MDDFLKHFNAQPYDPVKAHEYYLKNRQLKGRTTSGMSQEQKEAWTYSKDQITADKKKKLELAKMINDKKLDSLRNTANATRARISEKLKLLSEKLTKDAERERDRITDKVNADIAKLPQIPDSVTGEQRAILVERRNKEMDAIRNAASLDRTDLTEDTRSSRVISMDEVTQQREKIGGDLQAVIDKTREAYTEAKAKIVAEYETIYQKEYDKVLRTVAGKPKKQAKSKSKSKAKAKGKGRDKENIEGGFYYKKEWDAKNKKK